MLEESRKFATRGNVVDMAVGIVIGAAFGKVVRSFVKDLLMPPLGKLMGGVDFSNLFINPRSGSCSSLTAAQAAGAATIDCGVFNTRCWISSSLPAPFSCWSRRWTS